MRNKIVKAICIGLVSILAIGTLTGCSLTGDNVGQKEFSTTDQSSTSSYVTKQEFEETVMKLKSMYESLLNSPKKIEDVPQTAAQPISNAFAF